MTFSTDSQHANIPHPHFQSDVTEEQWQTIHPLLPAACHLGARRRVNLRAVVNGIRYASRTGCQWRDLPTVFGNWNTVYSYYREWKRKGVWQRVQQVLCETSPTAVLESCLGTEPLHPSLPIDHHGIATPNTLTTS